MKPDTLRRIDLPVPGGTLAAWDAGGQGTPILFQHGLGGDARQTAEAMPEGFRLITLECRGHGASPPLSPFSIARFADDVAALAEHLRLGPVIVGGLSMGAAIASRLAVTRPDLVRALVLARPAWVVEPNPFNMRPNFEVGALLARLRPAEARAAFAASPTARRLADIAPDNLASLLGFFDRPAPAVLAALLTTISTDGPGIAEGDLVHIGVPALILATQEDAIHPMPHAERLARLIPGARLATLTPKGRDKAAYLADFHNALSAFAKDIAHA